MRKPLALILAICLLAIPLTACSDAQAPVPSESPETQAPTTDPTETEPPTTKPPETEPTETEPKVWDFTVEGLASELTDVADWLDPVTCKTEDYDISYISHEHNDTVSVYCFAEKDGALFAVTISVGLSTIRSLVDGIYSAVINVANTDVEITEKDAEDRQIIIIYNPDVDVDVLSLPCSVAEINQNDFFSSEERLQTFNNCINAYAFDSLQEYVNQYIADCNPSEGDSAFKILDEIKAIVPELENCSIEYDSFEEKYTARYNGAEAIGWDTSLAVSASGRSINAFVGFMASDWLFFDKVSVKYSSDNVDTHFYDSWDIEHDVLSGGGVEEYADFYSSITGDMYQAIKDAQDVVIRFQNSDTKETYDHTLTEAEKNSVIVLSDIVIAYRNLSAMAKRFTNG